MDRAAEAVTEPSNTPITDRARFRITDLDVGTEAVRPGAMAEVESGQRVLLAIAKLTLKRIRETNSRIGAAHEYALECAIRVVEGK